MTKKIPTPPETKQRPQFIEEPPRSYPHCPCEDCVRARNNSGDPRALYTAHDMADAYMRGLAAAFAKEQTNGE